MQVEVAVHGGHVLLILVVPPALVVSGEKSCGICVVPVMAATAGHVLGLRADEEEEIDDTALGDPLGAGPSPPFHTSTYISAALSQNAPLVDQTSSR